MRQKLIALGILAAFAASGFSQTGKRDAEIRMLRENEILWNKDYEAKDVDKIVAHYADDAVLIGLGISATSGKEAIRKLLADMIADPALSLHFQTSRVEVAKSAVSPTRSACFTSR